MKISYPFLLSLIIIIVTCFSTANAQNSITGIITDAQTGETLPGVNILVKGTSQGTTTNADGYYSLTVKNLQDTLRFSYIGYSVQEIPINNKTEINVDLTTTTFTGEELVVVGYGTQNKATVTGSVSSVDGSKLEKTPTANVSNTFAGRIPGVIANNRSGEPGNDGSTIQIRGTATLGNNDPLIVVDGVPSQIGGLDRLDPNNIESVSVLKDASAAIYGARAANGVILVKTKRGKEGDIQASYSFNQGFSTPTRIPEMSNSATYAIIANEISFFNNKNGGMNQRYTKEEIQKFQDGSDPLNYPSTDWLQETLKPLALQSRHNLSVSGGTQSVQYRISVGFLNQDGLYENGETNFKQYNVRSSLDASVNKNLDFNLTLSGRQEDRRYPQSSATGIFRSAYRAYPTVNDYFDENELPSYGIEGDNPTVMATDAGGTNENPSYVLNGKLGATYKLPFLKGFSLDGYIAADKMFNFSKSFAKPYNLYQYEKQLDEFNQVQVGGQAPSLTETQDNTSLTTINLNLRFDNDIGVNHNFKGFIGYEQSEFKTDDFSASRLNFPTALTPNLSQGGSAAEDATNSGNSYEENRRNFLGRLSYDYSSKYLLELQFRYDGSSIFPEGEQFGFFPSISAGWRISSEPWFESAKFIDNLKIRASYGELGNDQIDPFQYFDTYTFDNRLSLGNNSVNGIYLSKLGNPNVTWEVSRKLDFGIEATLLKNLSFEATFFREKRDNILTYRSGSVPQLSGIVNPYNSPPLVPAENIGKVENKGLEGLIKYQGNSGGFQYSISGNITYARNKVIFMDEAQNTLPYQSQTGKPLGSQLLYNAIGIFNNEDELNSYPHVVGAEPGDIIYEDYNEDEQINADDRIRVERSNQPELVYGFSIGSNWKNFDLSILFQGQSRVTQYILPESGDVGNYPSYWADNRWRPDDNTGTYPKASTRASSSISGGLYPSTFWLRNAAFLRLKNIELGYNFAADIFPALNWKGGRVYISGFNLLTFTPAKGFDPEGFDEGGADSSGGTNQYFYPQQKIFNIGFVLNF